MRIRYLLYIIVSAALITSGSQSNAQYPLRQYLSIRSCIGPTISPDGKQVAFRTSITGISQLWKVSEKDLWPEQLTFFPSPINNAYWSPDGSSILVIVDKDGNEQFQFYLVKPDGSKITPLTENPKVRYNWGGWSGDGKQIFYSSNKRKPEYFDCYLMDVESKTEKRIYMGDGSFLPVALSHNGKTMAFIRTISNTDSELYIIDLPSGNIWIAPKPIGEVEVNPIDFSWDDQKLFIRTDQGREFENIATLDLQTRDIRFVRNEEHDVENAVMSTDGHYLAYTVNRDGFQDLEVVDLKARRPVSLPRIPRGLIVPGNFSADGSKLSLGIAAPGNRVTPTRLT